MYFLALQQTKETNCSLLEDIRRAINRATDTYLLCYLLDLNVVILVAKDGRRISPLFLKQRMKPKNRSIKIFSMRLEERFRSYTNSQIMGGSIETLRRAKHIPDSPSIPVIYQDEKGEMWRAYIFREGQQLPTSTAVIPLPLVCPNIMKIPPSMTWYFIEAKKK